ncbi:MAG: hypothetical protein KDC24_13405 [Saprospiraceae bacterium]|nr:hypothetical protein [Saprospiraceae bacterium]
MESITFQYPAWYILLCVLAGLILAGLLYYNDKTFKSQSRALVWGMGVLRFLTISIICLLLLEPLLKSFITETKNPVVVLAQDNSESIAAAFGEGEKETYNQQLASLEEALSKKYEVQSYTFGEEVKDGLSLTYEEKSTNISSFIKSVYDLYSNQNLGAVIIASDGIYNEGSNPIYTGYQLEAPVYTIGLGDTTIQKDLFIKRVFNNKIVYLGDRFSIQVDVAASNAAGTRTNLQVQKIEGGNARTLETIPVAIDKNDFFTTKEIVLNADKAGVQRYRITLNGVSGEVTTGNNVKDIFIDVLDARQKILILANAPHPDISALKQSLETSKNYEVTTAMVSDLKVKVTDFDFVILHQLPSYKQPISNILLQMDENKIPRLYVVGMQSDYGNFNRLQPLVEISTDGKTTNEVQAKVATDFNLFTLSDALKDNLPRFAPVLTPFGDFKQLGTGQTLLYQKIGKVETNFPLLTLGESNGIRSGVFAAEGLYKWRLFDFLQNTNHEVFNELIGKTVQYLSIKEDKRKFRVTLAKNIFDENESIVFDAELYNENFELINDPDASIVIKNEEGQEFPFTFNKAGQTYNLNAGIFPVGNYSYRASTSSNGRQQTFEGQFSVQPVQLELFQTTANHGLLKLLAENYGGQFLTQKKMAELPQMLEEKGSVKPVLYATSKTRSVINLKWIFFLLLFLLSSEWFLRRYFGAY